MTDFDVPFTVHPGIFQVLGGQLVSDRLRALSELVKNSYDADATVVEVRFDEGDPRQIKVSDDGHGMSLREIRNGWLQLGTPLKRQKTESEGNPASGPSMVAAGRRGAQSQDETVTASRSRREPGLPRCVDLQATQRGAQSGGGAA